VTHWQAEAGLGNSSPPAACPVTTDSDTYEMNNKINQVSSFNEALSLLVSSQSSIVTGANSSNALSIQVPG
jgi:hypothetical protein